MYFDSPPTTTIISISNIIFNDEMQPLSLSSPVAEVELKGVTFMNGQLGIANNGILKVDSCSFNNYVLAVNGDSVIKNCNFFGIFLIILFIY